MTKEERILRAKECLKAYNEVYYKDGDFYKADFWDYAEIFEMVLDAYEITKDEEYKAQLIEMHKYVMERYKETWLGHLAAAAGSSWGLGGRCLLSG